MDMSSGGRKPRGNVGCVFFLLLLQSHVLLESKLSFRRPVRSEVKVTPCDVVSRHSTVPRAKSLLECSIIFGIKGGGENPDVRQLFNVLET